MRKEHGSYLRYTSISVYIKELFIFVFFTFVWNILGGYIIYYYYMKLRLYISQVAKKK